MFPKLKNSVSVLNTTTDVESKVIISINFHYITIYIR